MNYLRGAFTAASQYYKDLPPINPATLTGAIDVIVIERRNDDGQVELACSPFHVRFGKWQVLRPAEKQVTVLLNGHPIPFNMKIGDAGEAFFVFETEEDIPEDLITSPILQPVQDAPESHPSDQSGRFGARQGSPTTPLSHIPPHEPEFLDLDSPQDHPPNEPAQPPVPKHDASTITTMTAIKNTATLVRDAATNIPRLVRDGLSRTSSNDSISPTNKTASDIILPREDIPPPDVTYHRDVVLDLAGYHSKGPSDRTVTSDDKWDENSDSKDSSGSNPEPPRTSTPEYSTNEMSNATQQPPRSTSAPPEYGGLSASPPPEYSWDWTARPQHSPALEDKSLIFSLPRDDPHRPSRPRLLTKVSSPQSQIQIQSHRSRSPIPEAEGGKLKADPEDPFKIWLDFEGQSFSFELSLCGATNDPDGALQFAQEFDAKRITFRTLLGDEGALHSDSIVVRWDDEYIFRSDNSPLMSALPKWRRRTLTEDVQRRIPLPPPEKAASPVITSTSTPSLSTTAATTTNPTSATASPATSIALAPSVKPVVRSRTWSRWWSRSYVSDDIVQQQQQQKNKVQAHAQSASTPVSASASVDKLISSSSTLPTRAATPDTTTLSVPLPPPSSVPFPQPPSSTTLPLQPPPRIGKKYAKTLRLTSDQLKTLNLNKGANSITFSLSATGQVACTARIFVWDSDDQVVVSDIDGTITKSDALGHVFTLIGRDWTHLGVAKLYSDVSRNGYKIMYLTSRAIGQADSTRDYLRSINQNGYQLPEGPVIMSPDRLLTSLHREVIMRKPEVFKMACLKDIRRLFGTTSQNAFYAGFGNRITDALSYRSVDIPSARIFTIDSTGELKMELLELAGYKSSYIHMTDLVDQMFPPINRKWAPEYTDFNFWRRVPISDIELPDLTSLTVPTMPPSPSLSASARSDVSVQSTLSRLRNFSLGRSSASVSPRALSPDGSGSARSSNNGAVTPKDNGYDNHNITTTTTNNNNNNNTSSNIINNINSNTNTASKHIRSAVSLDRFGSFLPSLGGSTMMDTMSSSSSSSYQKEERGGRGEREREVVFVPNNRYYRKSRPGSMPGSLDLSPNLQDSARWLEDEDEEDGYSGDEGGGGGGGGGGSEIGYDGYAEDQGAEHEQTFDDDLIATGEMENVPYL